ncbi:unnamed protein product, partial [Amoebophrya sp. A25]
LGAASAVSGQLPKVDEEAELQTEGTGATKRTSKNPDQTQEEIDLESIPIDVGMMLRRLGASNTNIINNSVAKFDSYLDHGHGARSSKRFGGGAA